MKKRRKEKLAREAVEETLETAVEDEASREDPEISRILYENEKKRAKLADGSIWDQWLQTARGENQEAKGAAAAVTSSCRTRQTESVDPSSWLASLSAAPLSSGKTIDGAASKRQSPLWTRTLDMMPRYALNLKFRKTTT